MFRPPLLLILILRTTRSLHTVTRSNLLCYRADPLHHQVMHTCIPLPFAPPNQQVHPFLLRTAQHAAYAWITSVTYAKRAEKAKCGWKMRQKKLHLFHPQGRANRLRAMGHLTRQNLLRAPLLRAAVQGLCIIPHLAVAVDRYQRTLRADLCKLWPVAHLRLQMPAIISALVSPLHIHLFRPLMTSHPL